MTLVIPDEILLEARLSPSELRVELAVYLYEKKRISIGKARKMAGLSLIDFQKALTQRNVYIHYDVIELETDLKNLNLT
ncbi:UPF0175 family protein [Runella sp. SP2]|uniref:UPF0175 family protein n=1 Tax=Runella sp. SP2 TaxID=2268026 RepID=UPI000F08FEE4|nr:UPF0175 family protein [Runella sp. SP2]AYQ33491.1 UPF0175 family protein [Runella sp. SP2]